MKTILILGAGKSATRLISYTLEQSKKYDWKVIVGDLHQSLAQEKVEGHENGHAVEFDVNNEEHRHQYIAQADVVASLLPYTFHSIVAKDCLKFKKHLVTASYVSDDSLALDAEFKAANLLFMGEIGLDPGIDHLAMMELLERIKKKGAKVNGLYSYTGALIHPDFDTNPWNYKFTWAPMNVVKAGQGVSQYMYENKAKYIPYNRVFLSNSARPIEGVGEFEVYPNRDSVKYMEKYSLEGIGTFLRGTLRKKGYCDAWNSFVKLGWTDDSYSIDVEGQTYSDLLTSFLPVYCLKGRSLEAAMAYFLGLELNDPIMDKLRWLELFNHKAIELKEGTPAQLLCHLLQEKWKLEEGDKDMIVMLHEVDYELNGEERRLTSSMVSYGEDEDHTAIANLVGLPVGMMVKLIATEQVDTTKLTGVRIPIMPEVYEPLLKELEEYGVVFNEKDTLLRTLKPS